MLNKQKYIDKLSAVLGEKVFNIYIYKSQINNSLLLHISISHYCGSFSELIIYYKPKCNDLIQKLLSSNDKAKIMLGLNLL